MNPRTLERIAYVEDEADIRAVARLALAHGGLVVDLFASGAEAVDRYRAGAAMPDLMILDVMMPGMGGPATLARLRELPGFASAPVMFMTAKIQKRDLEGLLSLGAVDVIPKPFDPMTLADEIRRRWDESCARQGA